MSKSVFDKSKFFVSEPLDLSQFVLIKHDKFFHEAFDDPDFAKAFLRQTLKKSVLEKLDMDRLEVFPHHFLTHVFKDLRADMVYLCPMSGSHNGNSFLTILEHKSANDPYAICQLTQYVSVLEGIFFKDAQDNGALTTNYRFPVILPMIVCHGETPFRGATCSSEFHDEFPEYEGYSLRIKADLQDLCAMSDNELPFDPSVPEIKPVLLLMKYIRSEDFVVIFQEVLRTLQPYNRIPKYSRLNRLMWFYAISCAVHITLADVQRIAKDVPNQNIEENEMSTLLERTKAEGRAEERAKMSPLLEQKKAEGRVEGKVDDIVLLLSSRIGFVPQRIEDQLNAIDSTDIAHLNELLLLAAKCESLDEFEKAL